MKLCFIVKWMEPEIIMLNEISQTEKKAHTSHVFSHMHNLDFFFKNHECRRRIIWGKEGD
jgi:hypothetical protein